MAGDLEIGQLQAGIQNLSSRFDRIETYLGKGVDRHTEVMTELALVRHSQENFTEYTARCDEDRQAMGQRIADVEVFQKNQIKVAAAAGGLLGFLAYGGGKAMEKFWGLFS